VIQGVTSVAKLPKYLERTITQKSKIAKVDSMQNPLFHAKVYFARNRFIHPFAKVYKHRNKKGE